MSAAEKSAEAVHFEPLLQRHSDSPVLPASVQRRQTPILTSAGRMFTGIWRWTEFKLRESDLNGLLNPAYQSVAGTAFQIGSVPGPKEGPTAVG